MALFLNHARCTQATAIDWAQSDSRFCPGMLILTASLTGTVTATATVTAATATVAVAAAAAVKFMRCSNGA